MSVWLIICYVSHDRVLAIMFSFRSEWGTENPYHTRSRRGSSRGILERNPTWTSLKTMRKTVVENGREIQVDAYYLRCLAVAWQAREHVSSDPPLVGAELADAGPVAKHC